MSKAKRKGFFFPMYSQRMTPSLFRPHNPTFWSCFRLLTQKNKKGIHLPLALSCTSEGYTKAKRLTSSTRVCVCVCVRACVRVRAHACVSEARSISLSRLSWRCGAVRCLDRFFLSLFIFRFSTPLAMFSPRPLVLLFSLVPSAITFPRYVILLSLPRPRGLSV